MRLLIILTMTALVGCAARQPRSPHYSACEYEAEKATPPSNNVFTDVMRKQDLIAMCIQQKGG